jgi:hypothetical protein
MARAAARSLSGRQAESRYPPATPAEAQEVLRVARGLADEFDPNGRSAIVLAGS